MSRALTIWTLDGGLVGSLNQALGIGEAIAAQSGGAGPIIVPVAPRLLLTKIPPRLCPVTPWALRGGFAGLPAELPDIVIACGKRTAVPALIIRKIARAKGRRCLAVYAQTPPVAPRHFDLVAAPAHDGLRGPNVVVTRAAPHRVTPDRLTAAADRFRAELEALPRPRVAVLIGGSNRRYRLTPSIAGDLGAALRKLAEEAGAGLMITTSRRTGAENEKALRDALGGVAAQFWDGAGDNPYFAYLAWADHIVVTGDSVSMASEAAATGKPVHVVALEGHSRRIDAFHAALRDAGIARPFDGALESWTYAPPDDTGTVAARVLTLFQAE